MPAVYVFVPGPGFTYWGWVQDEQTQGNLATNLTDLPANDREGSDWSRWRS